MTTRFAIYAVPGTGPADPAGAALRETAEQWLGRSVTGSPVTPGVPAGCMAFRRRHSRAASSSG